METVLAGKSSYINLYNWLSLQCPFVLFMPHLHGAQLEIISTELQVLRISKGGICLMLVAKRSAAHPGGSWRIFLMNDFGLYSPNTSQPVLPALQLPRVFMSA